MCGISNRHHPPGARLFELHPLHGRANNLVITLKRRHVLITREPNFRKAIAETIEAPSSGSRKRRWTTYANPYVRPGAQRRQPEHAALAEVHLQPR